VACVFGISVYRAATQSITVDEAFTYDLYIDKPFREILRNYSTKNHILNTWLCRLSVKTLGLSELTFRLPSLFGGLLYLAFVYRLCRDVFRNWWTFLFAVAALAVNPLIMDFLSIARGYGLSLGFFVAAVYFVIHFLDAEPNAANPNTIVRAASLLGLSISANLTFTFPAVALAAMLTLFGLFDAKATGGWKHRLWRIAGGIWLPMAITAAVFVAVPVIRARAGTFRTDLYGTDSLLDTGRNLTQRSLFHQFNMWVDAIPPSAHQCI
jgi:uncharacterized membrane protein